MGAHDIVNVLRLDTGSGQLVQQHAARRHMPTRGFDPSQTILVVADARVNEDSVMTRTHQKGLYGHSEIAGAWAEENS
jgi:hypothetical protein